MIIDTCQIFSYDLELNRPLYVQGKSVNKREGLLLKLTVEGISGYGDIAPLHGVSKERIEDALKELKKLQATLPDTEIPENLINLDGGFEKWLSNYNLSSSVQFGVELAILNLLANVRQCPLSNLISETAYDEIQINGLLQGNKEEIKSQARELIESGFHSLKLKVSNDVEEAIGQILALNPIIDVNQGWDISKAVHFGHEIGLSTVDYIEEPFKNLDDIGDFFMKTTIPVALDETLLEKNIEDFRMIDGCEILVLKPTLLGGIEKTFQLIQKARGVGLSTVISSCYESSIGILALANLAGISSRHQGAGLDTLKWFKSDVLTTPIQIKHGKINIENQTLDESNINYDVLTEINP